MKTRRLKHLAQIQASNVDKKSAEGDIPVRLCNYVDVYRNHVITDDLPFMSATATRAQATTFELRAGDVIVTKDSERPDDIGVPAYVEEDLPGVVCGYHLTLLRTKRAELHPKFLFWFLRSRPAHDHFTVSAQGITRFALGYADLGSVPIPIPPLDEQQATAGFLDDAVAKIDALVETKRRLQVVLRKERDAFLTSKLWPELPPADWSMKSLMRLTQPNRPIMYGIVLPGPNVAEGVPLIKGGDVSNHRLSVGLLNKTSFEIEAPFARARLKGGDIVLTIRGGYGDAALVPDELTGANITQDIARIAPGPSVSGRWLLRVLQSQPLVQKINNEALGAAVQGVNIRDVKRYQVPVPPLAEQERLVSEIEERLSTFAKLDKQLRGAEQRLEEYRASLITHAVTGQIDNRSVA